MRKRCFLEESGGCLEPAKIAADLRYSVRSLGIRGSLPLCFAHAVKPYVASRLLKGILGASFATTVKVVPREPYRSALRRFGLD